MQCSGRIRSLEETRVAVTFFEQTASELKRVQLRLCTDCFAVRFRFELEAELALWRRLVQSQWISYGASLRDIFGYGYVSEYRSLSLHSQSAKLR